MTMHYFGTVVNKRKLRQDMFPVSISVEPVLTQNDKLRPVTYYSFKTVVVKFTNLNTGYVVEDIRVTIPSDYELTTENLLRYLKFQSSYGRPEIKENYEVNYTLGGSVVSIKDNDVITCIAAIDDTGDSSYSQTKFINSFTIVHDNFDRKNLRYEVGFDDTGLFVTVSHTVPGESLPNVVAWYEMQCRKALDVEAKAELALGLTPWPYTNISGVYKDQCEYGDNPSNKLIWRNIDTFTYLVSSDGKLVLTLEKNIREISKAVHRHLLFLGTIEQKAAFSDIIGEHSGPSPVQELMMVRECIKFCESL